MTPSGPHQCWSCGSVAHVQLRGKNPHQNTAPANVTRKSTTLNQKHLNSIINLEFAVWKKKKKGQSYLQKGSGPKATQTMIQRKDEVLSEFDQWNDIIFSPTLTLKSNMAVMHVKLCIPALKINQFIYSSDSLCIFTQLHWQLPIVNMFQVWMQNLLRLNLVLDCSSLSN